MGYLALVIIVLIVIWLLTRKESKPPALDCIVDHVDRDESYLSYYDQQSKLHTETDGCSGCIQGRAEQLQEQGVKLIRVEFGRRNTGEL